MKTLIVVVSDNPETLDGLQRYLSSVGVAVRATRDLAHAATLANQARSVVVVFPDDYPFKRVHAALALLREHKPPIPVVVVTSDIQHFHGSALVLPKPAWGWSILDAVRDHLEETE